jgi:hypothetical protein
MQSNIFQDAVQSSTRVIGRKEVNVVFRGGDAHTDGNTVVLPALPSTATVDPVSADVIRGFRDHESLHIRCTDMSSLTELTARHTQSKMYGDLTNIVEDIRIERAGVQEYAGMAHTLACVQRAAGEILKREVNGNEHNIKSCPLPNQALISLQVIGRKRMGMDVGYYDTFIANVLPEVRAWAERMTDSIMKIKTGAETGVLKTKLAKAATFDGLAVSKEIYEDYQKTFGDKAPPALQPPKLPLDLPPTGDPGKPGNEPGIQINTTPTSDGKGEGEPTDDDDCEGEKSDDDKRGSGSEGADDGGDAGAGGGDESDADGDPGDGGEDLDGNEDGDGEDGDDADDGNDEEGDQDGGNGEGEDDAEDGDDDGGSDDGGQLGDQSVEGDIIDGPSTGSPGTGSGGDHSIQGSNKAPELPSLEDLTKAALQETVDTVTKTAVIEGEKASPWIEYTTELRLKANAAAVLRIACNHIDYAPVFDGQMALIRDKAAMIRRLLELQMQARWDRVWQGGKTRGRLHQVRIVDALHGAQNVYQAREDGRQMDTLLVISIDCSSSMNSGDRMKKARLLALALCSAMERTGVDVEVEGWGNDNLVTIAGAIGVSKAGYIARQTDATRELHKAPGRYTNLGMYFRVVFKSRKQRLVDHDVKQGFGGMEWFTDGTTPMPSAVDWTLSDMVKEPHSKKILLVLTDGQPDNVHTDLGENTIPNHMRNLHRVAERNGIHIIGVGICVVDQIMARYFTDRLTVDTTDMYEKVIRRLAKLVDEEVKPTRRHAA